MKNIDKIAQHITKHGTKDILIHAILGTKNWIVCQKIKQDNWLVTLLDPMGNTTYNLGILTENQHIGLWKEIIMEELEHKANQILLAKELKKNSGLLKSNENKKCSKCGAETTFDNDLHCRSIFVEEINKLLLSKEFIKAKDYYFSQSFDNSWKESFLNNKCGEFRRLVVEELEKNDENQKESVSPSTDKGLRTSHCYVCKRYLDNFTNAECEKCGWIICPCGACGCGCDYD